MRIETFRNLARSGIEIEWIVEELISPGGWTFFVGEAGTGKSMMAIQLCDSLQLGKPFLGFNTKKHNCLYIQADSGLIEWKKQVEVLASDSAAFTVHQLERGFLDEPEQRQYIKNLVWGTYSIDSNPKSLSSVIKHVPFNFVIFDCLHAITDGDLNTKTAMSSTLQHIDEIVTKTTGSQSDGTKLIERVHFVLIHHPNASVKRGAVAGSGHKGFSDACSTKLTLGSNLLVLEKSKVTSKKEISLERGSNGQWLVPSDSFSTTNWDRELGL